MIRFISSLTLIFAFSARAAVILIDPGHGGDDLGAKTSYWYKEGNEKKLQVYFEKNIVMGFAQEIFDELKRQGHRVYLTRTFDRTVGLDERAKMADKINADIFLSIHANASGSAKSRGVETFYLNNHTDKAVKKIEKLENIESKGKQKIVDKILIDLAVKKSAPLSKTLADNIHSELRKNTIRKNKLRDRGIKPGLFFVLALSNRPAVLLEVGFLTNKKEGKLIMSKKFQKQYAQDVAKGIRKYIGKQPKQGPSLL